MMQISSSVQQTMEDVALKPAAVTRWAASRVPVTTDTLEMDLRVQVSHIKHVRIQSLVFKRNHC